MKTILLDGFEKFFFYFYKEIGESKKKKWNPNDLSSPMSEFDFKKYPSNLVFYVLFIIVIEEFSFQNIFCQLFKMHIERSILQN